MQITPNLDRNNISMNETFSENLVKIRSRDVTLRHVTSFLGFAPKKGCKNADIIKNIVRLEFFLVEQSKGFHLRGQPTLYDINLICYRIFRRGPEKPCKMLIFAEKVLTSAK